MKPRSRLRGTLALCLALLVAAPLAYAAYGGRNAQGPQPLGQILAYRGADGTIPGAAYRSSLAFVDTAGDVTAPLGLGAVQAISCGRYTQVSCSTAGGISTGQYGLRCMRYKVADATGALLGVGFTDATSLASTMTEAGRFLGSTVTFDTDGASAVRIFLVSTNTPAQATLDTVDLFAETN